MLINSQVATENTINFHVSRYYNSTTTNTQTICSIAQHFYLQHYSLSLIYSLFNLWFVSDVILRSRCVNVKFTGLPLGPLNPLKSFFKHMVHNVPIS